MTSRPGRRRTAAAALLAMACCAFPLPAAGPGAADPEAVTAGRLAEIIAAGSRTEGSASLGTVTDIVIAACRAAGAEVAVTGFDDSREGYSRSSIVEAAFAGTGSDELVFAVPLDGWYGEGPEAGSAAIALALVQVERFGVEAREGLTRTLGLRFLFLGAERRGPRPAVDPWQRDTGPQAGLGSRLWASRARGTGGSVAVYLSFDELPAAVELINASGTMLSPYWIYESARRSLAASGFPYLLSSNRMQLHRLGLTAARGPLDPWLEAELPAVELRAVAATGGEGAARSSARFSAFVDRLIADNAGGIPDSWDRHYISFQVGRTSLVIREGTYMGFLMLFAALSSALVLVRSLLNRAAARIMLRRLPIFAVEVVLVFAAAAISVLSGIVLAAAEGGIFGSGEYWRGAPLLFALSHVGVALATYLSLHALFVALRFLPADPAADQSAAQGWLGIDVFVFAFAAPSLSFYFAWGFLVSEALRIVRKRWAPVAALLLMYAPLHLIVAEMAARPEPAVLGSLIQPVFLAALLAAATVAPFLAYAAASTQGVRGGRRLHLRRSLSFALVAGGVWTLCLVLSGIPIRKPVALLYGESIDLDTERFEATLVSTRAVGRLELTRDGEPLLFESGDGRARAGGEASCPTITFEGRSSAFLDRSNIDLFLRFELPPDRLELSLLGSRDLAIADCSLPVSVSLDGYRAEILAPDRPGMEFAFRLTLPASYENILFVRATYLEPPRPLVAPEGILLTGGGFTVSRSFGFAMEGPR